LVELNARPRNDAAIVFDPDASPIASASSSAICSSIARCAMSIQPGILPASESPLSVIENELPRATA
jgi:hypothetical protein